MGKAAEPAGGWVPWAFLAGAVVVAFSSCSCIRCSTTDPSSGGIAVLAIAGILTAGLSSPDRLCIVADRTAPDHGRPGFLAGVTLCIQASKGFTTITNQGADLKSRSATSAAPSSSPSACAPSSTC